MTGICVWNEYMYWLSFKKKKEKPITGLILPGGGARNAYQAGVLKAIGDMLPEDAENPFPVISGVSSGAMMFKSSAYIWSPSITIWSVCRLVERFAHSPISNSPMISYFC